MSCRLEPVVYQHPQMARPSASSAYARLVESLTRFTDVEPDETFTQEDVIALGEELCRSFQDRVRSVEGDVS